MKVFVLILMASLFACNEAEIKTDGSKQPCIRMANGGESFSNLCIRVSSWSWSEEQFKRARPLARKSTATGYGGKILYTEKILSSDNTGMNLAYFFVHDEAMPSEKRLCAMQISGEAVSRIQNDALKCLSDFFNVPERGYGTQFKERENFSFPLSSRSVVEFDFQLLGSIWILSSEFDSSASFMEAWWPSGTDYSQY